MNSHLKKLSLLALLALSGSAQAMSQASDGKMEGEAPLKLAILASGNGSNAEEIWNYFEQPDKKGIVDFSVMICNRKAADARVYERAERHGVPTVYLPAKVFKKMSDPEKVARRKEYAQEMIQALKEHGVTPENGLICGAGFMVIIHKDFLDHYNNRVISIHPTLLPSFAGDTGIDDAWAYGVKTSGPTVHIVEEGMDTGPIIGQNPFIVSPDETRDSFEEKTHKQEWRLYPWVIEQIARGKMTVVEKEIDNPHIIENSEGKPEMRKYVIMPPMPREISIDNDEDAS